MTDQLEPSTTLAPTPTAPPASQASAVDRCAQAWKRTQELASLLPKKERHKQEYDSFVEDESADAFRNAMPPLIGLENIQDYIACVAYASLHKIFSQAECQRLFECAKFALAVAAPQIAAKKSLKIPQSSCHTSSERYNTSKFKELTDDLLINIGR